MALLYFVLLCCIFCETSAVIYMTTEAGEITTLQSYGYDMPSGTTSFSFSVNTCSNTSVTFLDVNRTELFHVIIGVNDSFSSINIRNRTLSLSKDPGIGECSPGHEYVYDVLWTDSKINVTKIAPDRTKTVVLYPPPTYTGKDSREDIKFYNIRDVAMSTTGKGEWNIHKEDSKLVFKTRKNPKSSNPISLENIGFDVGALKDSFVFEVKACGDVTLRLDDISSTGSFLINISYIHPNLSAYTVVLLSTSAVNFTRIVFNQTHAIKSCNESRLFKVNWPKEQLYLRRHEDCGMKVVLHVDNTNMYYFRPSVVQVAADHSEEGLWKIHYTDGLKDCNNVIQETTTTLPNTTASMTTTAATSVMTTTNEATKVTTKPTTTTTTKVTTTTTIPTTTTTKVTTTTTIPTTTTTKVTTTTTIPTTTTTKVTTTTTIPTTTTTKVTTTTNKPTTTTTKATTTKATTTKATTTTTTATTTTTTTNRQKTDTAQETTSGITSIPTVTVSKDKQCAKLCLCYQSNVTYNSTELKEMIAELKEALTVTKTTTSNYIRSKTSAPDDRPSAVGIGYIGAALLAAVILGVVALDFPNLLQAVAMLRQNLLHMYTHTEQNVRFDPISME